MLTNTNVTTDDAGYNFWGGSYLNVGSNYITSGSVWKLREVVLRYDFPKKWYSQIKDFPGYKFCFIRKEPAYAEAKDKYLDRP